MQLFFNGLVTGSIIACAAVGITLVYGVLKLVNFAFAYYGALATGASVVPIHALLRELLEPCIQYLA